MRRTGFRPLLRRLQVFRSLSTSPLESIRVDTAQYTLPSTSYYAPAHYQVEQETIFSNVWLLAGHRNAILPKIGSYIEMNIAGESIMLVRAEDNAVNGYFNVCPHRAHQLVVPGSGGQLKSKVFMCPNHGWSFHARTGELVKARHSEEVADFCRADYGLRSVAVVEQAGLIFVNLHTSALQDRDSSFGEIFSPQLMGRISEKIPGIDSPDMKRLAVKETVIQANWKILVDNFLECYHCDIAHKAFVDMVEMDGYTTEVNQHTVLFESQCKPENQAYCFQPDDPIQSVFFCWLWPYSVVYSAPGQPNLSILQFIPITPTTTLRRSERFALLPDDTSSAVAVHATTSTDTSTSAGAEETGSGTSNISGSAGLDGQADARVNYLNQVLLEEDTSICESVQRGISSRGYERGRFIIANNKDKQPWYTELAVAQFHNLVKHYTGIQ